MLPWQCRLRLLIPDTRGQSKRRSGRALGCCCCATTQKPYPLIPSSWRRSKVAQPIRCSILVARRSFLLCIECIVVGVVLEKWRLVADNHDDDDCHHTSSKKKLFFYCAPCAYSDRDLDFRLQLTTVVSKTQGAWWWKEEGDIAWVWFTCKIKNFKTITSNMCGTFMEN